MVVGGEVGGGHMMEMTYHPTGTIALTYSLTNMRIDRDYFTPCGNSTDNSGRMREKETEREGGEALSII